MNEFGISVKGFIVDNNKLLILKRSRSSNSMPNTWEIPGGRLKIGEDIEKGVIREVKEETGIDIDVVAPFKVRNFIREDGQFIIFIVFFCKPISKQVVLSDEHQEFKWIDLDLSDEELIDYFDDGFYMGEVRDYRKLFSNKSSEKDKGYLNDYRRDVHDWVSQFKEGYWKPMDIMVRLTEETGELAREVNHRWGPKIKKASEDKKEVGEEIADIIFTLTCLANSLDINLEKELKRNISKISFRDKDRFEKKI